MNMPITCPTCGRPPAALARFGAGDDATLALRCARCGDLTLSGAAVAVAELAHHSSHSRLERRLAGWRSRGDDRPVRVDAREWVDDPEALRRHGREAEPPTWCRPHPKTDTTTTSSAPTHSVSGETT